VICSTEYEQSDWESTRRSFQLVRSYEENRRAFDSKGGRRPQSGINDGERRLFDISSASSSGERVWTAEIETLIDIATPRRRLTVEVY